MSRQLPSLSALRTFEAAARLSSFKDAAQELAVTPTAISHQVKHLESDLGVRLFVRRVRRVHLTEAGQMLQAGCAEALDGLERTVSLIRRRSGRATITISLGPIFASRWLSPRLARFWRRCPEVDLRLHHARGAVDFKNSDIDLAIVWGDGRWPDVEVMPLLPIQVAPVLSPALLKQPMLPTDLLRLRLLHEGDERGWQEWFEAQAVSAQTLSGVVIDDAHVALQAAVDGQGVALCVLPFIADELATGRLVRPFKDAFTPSRAYYLVHPKGAMQDRALRLLRDWLLEEAA